MATERIIYHPTHPGFGALHRGDKYHFGGEEPSGFMAAYLSGALFMKNSGAWIGGPFPYTSGQWTVTTGGTGDAQAAAVTPGGGVLITYPSDDNFDTTLDDAAVIVGANLSGKVLGLRARIQVSDADGLGFKIGLTTGGGAAALPFGTNYTDVIGFSKPIASAAMVGTVRGNSGTAADTGTLATLSDATEIDIGFYAMCHATTPMGAWCVNGTVTTFTGNQLLQLIAILTTPPTNMYWTIHGTGVTGTNPTMTVTSFMTQIDT